MSEKLQPLIDPDYERRANRKFAVRSAIALLLFGVTSYLGNHFLGTRQVDPSGSADRRTTHPTLTRYAPTPHPTRFSPKIRNPEILQWEYQEDWSQFDQWLIEQGIPTPIPPPK